MTFNFEYKGQSVCVLVSKNNGEYEPMVDIMSYETLTIDEKREIRDIARNMYQTKNKFGNLNSFI
jgi:hypothetical protein